MSVVFQPVKTAEDQEKLAKLADEIWHEYWPSRIGKTQTDYMVEQFQSLNAIKRDMATHNYEYWFICVDEACADSEKDSPTASDENHKGCIVAATNRIVGYTGGHVEPETNRFFISKLYLLKEERGHHFASKAITFYEQLCRERGLSAMYLTVNKYNDLAIRAYEAKGFETIDKAETDIGDGFIMDDFIMEKKTGV